MLPRVAKSVFVFAIMVADLGFEISKASSPNDSPSLNWVTLFQKFYFSNFLNWCTTDWLFFKLNFFSI